LTTRIATAGLRAGVNTDDAPGARLVEPFQTEQASNGEISVGLAGPITAVFDRLAD